MSTIESIESRIQDLGLGIVRLKVARNALTPFGRVPPDLLLDIAQLTVEDLDGYVSKEVRILTFVCYQTRSVLAGTPRLWRKVDLSKSKQWVNHCVTRAGPIPLRCCLRFVETKKLEMTLAGIQKQLSGVLPNTAKLHVHTNYWATDERENMDTIMK